MERNRELFEKIAAQIEETPHLWDQDTFADEGKCGTVMCVAGWATHFTCGLTTHPEDPESLMPANGEGFADHAAEVLGLDRYETSDLFFGMWDQVLDHDPGAAAEFLRAIGRGAKFTADGDFTE